MIELLRGHDKNDRIHTHVISVFDILKIKSRTFSGFIIRTDVTKLCQMGEGQEGGRGGPGRPTDETQMLCTANLLSNSFTKCLFR